MPQSKMWKGIPDLQPTAQNVYKWNLGRHAIRKYALYFRRRMEFFVGIYIFALTCMCVYEFVSTVVVIQSGGRLHISSAMCLELYLSVTLCLGALSIIRTGILANRQMEIHKSCIEHYRTRLAGHAEDQRESMRAAGYDKAAVEALVGPVKALQTALKHYGKFMLG